MEEPSESHMRGEVGLLKSKMMCPSCAKDMTLSGTRRDAVVLAAVPSSAAVLLMYAWASRKPVTVAARETEVSKVATIDMFNFCRDMSSNEMLSSATLNPDVWLFGDVGRTTGKRFGRITFHDCMKPTLSAMIGQHIRPDGIACKEAAQDAAVVQWIHGLPDPATNLEHARATVLSDEMGFH
ncbi:hypothetical protein H257_03448 [Aphanomyces astaci]|uniref:Uncharacterized protein n=1 Tax=Aphanomyces astaci TaxID=112090 RepID=W4GXV8_APHAT|nr:hypothetical protein H257_03448 [Aphanomyces astaci]ETV84161.1 hypothetical protein H257_03448 [Aphanomyces astaci]|eukprot:XP_009825853.1 hypothetical protein H257_03448 [Aphanomyces astaci]